MTPGGSYDPQGQLVCGPINHTELLPPVSKQSVYDPCLAQTHTQYILYSAHPSTNPYSIQPPPCASQAWFCEAGGAM